MTFEIYAIREVGSKEVRYIGQTGKGCATRLGFLVSLGRRGIGEPDMRQWLRACSFNVEAIVLDHAETRDEAKSKEQLAIRMFWAAGHRLVNRQSVPRGNRPSPVDVPKRRPLYPYQIAAY